MIRAIETADLIRTQLPADISVTVDPLLCEGAPIPPEPPVGHWKPQVYVIISLKFESLVSLSWWNI